MMTTSNPSRAKVRRAMALRKAHRDFIQAVNEESNARDLNDAAKEAGVVPDVVIDVAVGTRSGIPAGDGYLFIDMQYMAIGGERKDAVYDDFAPSLTVVTTVMNNRFPNRLTTDAGAKA